MVSAQDTAREMGVRRTSLSTCQAWDATGPHCRQAQSPRNHVHEGLSAEAAPCWFHFPAHPRSHPVHPKVASSVAESLGSVLQWLPVTRGSSLPHLQSILAQGGNQPPPVLGELPVWGAPA